MPQKMGKGGYGPENYDADTGKFVAGSGGSGSGDSNSPAAAAAAAPSNFASQLFRAKGSAQQANSGTNVTTNSLFKPKGSDNGQQQQNSDVVDFNNFLEELNKQNNDKDWHQNHGLITVDDVIQNIEKYASDNILSYIKKYPRPDGTGRYAWHHSTLGGVQNEYGAPVIFTNAIAKEMFKKAQAIDTQEYNKLINQINSYNGGISQRNTSYNYNPLQNGNLIHISRGSHSTDAISDFLRDVPKSDLLLTWGAYHSCVYTAYTYGTAQGYASGTNNKGQKGHIMEAVVDKSDGRYCNWSKAKSLTNEFRSKKNIWLPKLKQAIKDKVGDDTETDNILYVMEKAIDVDNNITALMCGYRFIYVESEGYALMLNWDGTRILDKGYEK